MDFNVLNGFSCAKGFSESGLMAMTAMIKCSIKAVTD